MKYLAPFTILLLLPAITYQKSDPASPTYIGAVAGYKPVYKDKDNNKNLENYIKFIKKAAEFNADILVFPESSLSIPWSGKKQDVNRIEGASYIPDPDEKIAPCDYEKYAQTIRNISCAAKEYKMYVVINHQEKVYCDWKECPSDNFLIYNTNVVFDRYGVVIARYRKQNLFFEPGTNITEEVEFSTFKTDFGVKFGQFICFDLLFKSPALELIKKLGIKDIVYSTNWVSTLPFAFSFESQAGWAYTNDVNFLAAGLNNPLTASGGTGIYIGRKGYISVSVDDQVNTLMVAKIPKFDESKKRRAVNIDLASLKIYNFSQSEMYSTPFNSSKKFPHLTNDVKQYVTELIDLKTNVYSKTLYHLNMKCDFKLNVTYDETAIKPDTDYYRYRLVAFNGVMSLNGAFNASTKICGIISCINDTLDGCGQLHDSNKTISKPITFNYLDISVDKMTIGVEVFMPVTLTQSMIPLNRTDYKYKTAENENNFRFQLYTAKNDLLTFSIVGRNFEDDGKELTPYPSSASSTSISSLLLLVAIFLKLFIFNI